jgi:hypothetical protein
MIIMKAHQAWGDNKPINHIKRGLITAWWQQAEKIAKHTGSSRQDAAKCLWGQEKLILHG